MDNLPLEEPIFYQLKLGSWELRISKNIRTIERFLLRLFIADLIEYSSDVLLFREHLQFYS
ncbi:hypothetical protein C7K38_04825 [Tetragenococcus osmophilus]|uniref:Uncharacterized protein n=1 Tax=Tetragenococcus osmophilus TaxID=526944 RepID=A0ABM7A8D9_9ENTE|nr:hypothetical protein C7K38_04825 [Tetragenococcus osmophilus]GMA53426.1 hypothetical protein GCM10025857_47830 [Alicyclobacillus contaminans]